MSYKYFGARMNKLFNLFSFAVSAVLIPIYISGIDLQTVKTQNPCSHEIVRRAAFDIGSGQIKMQVSDVDITVGKIANVLLADSSRVALREDLVKSLDGRFSPEIENKLVQAIKELIRKSEPFHPQSYQAAATESFRLAKNGYALVDRIKKETGLNITIIPQEEEGVLGFISATNEANVNPERVVSWDFGGGSFQITTKCGDQFCVYQGKIGKIPFRNTLLEIQGKDVNQTLTPNPIYKNDLYRALQFIKKNVQDVPAQILQKLLQPDVIVLGVGINPLWSMENNESYDQERVMQEIKKRLGLDDNAIMMKDSIDKAHKDSAAFVVSNLILAYSLMKTLNIHKVEYVGTQSANAIGTLLSQKYWKDCRID